MKTLAGAVTGATILAGLLYFNSLTLAQQPQDNASGEALKIGLAVDVVSLDVMVTDRQGRAVTGLNRDNLGIYEDGVKQSISFFSAERAPVSWGLVLDRSGSMRGMIQDVYQAALHVVDEGSLRDEVFIATFNNNVQTVSDFTTDHHKLGSSISGLGAGGRTALYDAIASALTWMEARQTPKESARSCN